MQQETAAAGPARGGVSGGCPYGLSMIKNWLRCQASPAAVAADTMALPVSMPPADATAGTGPSPGGMGKNIVDSVESGATVVVAAQSMKAIWHLRAEDVHLPWCPQIGFFHQLH
ncbi:hypothetical protein ABZP36_009428 [Zizania latifolia]